MKNANKRLDDLERAILPDEITVIVNWDPDPAPAEPGVKVITWEGVDHGQRDETTD